MKILVSVGFLLLTAASLYAGVKRQRRELELLGRADAPLERICYHCVMLIVSLSGFMLLTSFFSLGLVTIALGVSLFGTLVYFLAGVVAGFALDERRRKIGLLAAIRQFEVGLAGGIRGRMPITLWIQMAVGWTFLLLSLVALWVYWRYPGGLPGTRALLALVQFTVPAVLANVLLTINIWPVVAFEYMDDDVRNASLAFGFASVAMLAVNVFLPVWFLRQEPAAAARLPPLWIFMAAPFVVYVVMYVLPFFVGLYMHRHRSRQLYQWHRDVLADMLKAVQIPAGTLRDQRLEELRRKLDRELERAVSKNVLLSFYYYLATGRSVGALEHTRQQRMALAGVAPQTIVDSVDDHITAVVDDETTATELRLEELKQELENPLYPSSAIVDMLWNSREELVSWDLRFAHVHKMTQTRAMLNNAANIKDALKLELAEATSLTKRNAQHRNVFAAALVVAANAVAVWAFKTWESDIVGLLLRMGSS